jgi:hypothetical protein
MDYTSATETELKRLQLLIKGRLNNILEFSTWFNGLDKPYNKKVIVQKWLLYPYLSPLGYTQQLVKTQEQDLTQTLSLIIMSLLNSRVELQKIEAELSKRQLLHNNTLNKTTFNTNTLNNTPIKLFIDYGKI